MYVYYDDIVINLHFVKFIGGVLWVKNYWILWLIKLDLNIIV